MQRKHDAAKDRANDGSDAPDAERPSHAGRANVGWIERGGQRVGSGLPANDARARKKCADHDSGDGMRVAEQGNTESAQKISKGKNAVGAEPVHKYSKGQRRGHASALKNCGRDDGKGERNSGVVKNSGQPARQEIDIDQAHEESNPQESGRKGTALAE